MVGSNIWWCTEVRVYWSQWRKVRVFKQIPLKTANFDKGTITKWTDRPKLEGSASIKTTSTLILGNSQAARLRLSNKALSTPERIRTHEGEGLPTHQTSSFKLQAPRLNVLALDGKLKHWRSDASWHFRRPWKVSSLIANSILLWNGATVLCSALST